MSSVEEIWKGNKWHLFPSLEWIRSRRTAYHVFTFMTLFTFLTLWMCSLYKTLPSSLLFQLLDKFRQRRPLVDFQKKNVAVERLWVLNEVYMKEQGGNLDSETCFPSNSGSWTDERTFPNENKLADFGHQTHYRKYMFCLLSFSKEFSCSKTAIILSSLFWRIKLQM